MDEAKQKLLILVLILIPVAACSFFFFRKPIPAKIPVPKEECLLLAKEMEKSVNEGNPDFLNQTFSHFGFLEKLGQMFNFRNRRQLSKLTTTFENELRFGSQFTQIVLENNGHFAFTNYYRDSRRISHLVFRIYSDLGLNFYDFEVEYVRGKAQIIDALIFSTGITMTEATAKKINAYQQKKVYSSDEQVESEVLTLQEEVNVLLKQEQLAECVDLLLKHQPQLQHDLTFKGLELNVFSKLEDPKLFLEAYEQLQEHFPQAKELIQYWGVFYHVFREDGPALRSAIHSLERITGYDTLFTFFEGQARMYERRYLQAIQALDKVIQVYPFLSEPYWVKIEALIRAQHYQQAVEWLEYMIPLFELTQENIDWLVKQYPAFENSKSYRKWRGFKNI